MAGEDAEKWTITLFAKVAMKVFIARDKLRQSINHKRNTKELIIYWLINTVLSFRPVCLFITFYTNTLRGCLDIHRLLC